jgi:hypothetical protein
MGRRKNKGKRKRREVHVGDSPGGNYTGQIPRDLPAGLHEVDVLHDDWCAIFRGNPCNCEPIVRKRQ